MVAVNGTTHAGNEVDPAAVAEGRDRLAGAGVEGNQPRVGCAEQDSPIIAILPVAHAAMDENPMRRLSRLVAARIEQPVRLTGSRIDRSNLTGGGAGVQDPVDEQRRRLIGKLEAAPFFLEIAGRGAPAPDYLKLVHIGGVDLIERGVLVIAVSAAVRVPLRGPLLQRGGESWF